MLAWFAAPGGGGGGAVQGASAVPCSTVPPCLPWSASLAMPAFLALFVTHHTLPCPSPACAQVPMDQPKNGLDMITRFTRGEPLATAGPVAGSHSYMRHPPADQSSARMLPGAMWQLRRAMPDRQTSLSASEE